MPPGHASPDPWPTQRSHVPIWVIAVAMVVMLGLAGTVIVMIRNPSRAVAGSSFPGQWDSRIAPYAHIAERQRGLLFKHPVAVRFQTPAEFEKAVRVDQSKLDAHGKTQLDQFSGLMRAFGLISGNVDLFKAFNDATGSGTLAYYSFDDKRIYIRGMRLTPSVRPTLVHELTHALQDQYFDLGAREQKLGKSKNDDTTEESVFDAMAEGDAERTADGYRSTLTPAQLRRLARSESADQGGIGKQLAKVPKVVLTLIGAPYVLGEGLMQLVAADGGNTSVNRLFRTPPKHEIVLLDPFRVLQHETGATTVAVPKLGSGEKKFETGELGALTWYLMLAQRLPLRRALAATDGWGGDSYVGFERGGTSCARVDYAGRTSTDTARMLGALRSWAAAAPGAPTTVSASGKLVHLESCDPGKAVLVRTDHSEDAMAMVATRTGVGVTALRHGAPPARARCLANVLVDNFPVAKLQDPSYGRNDPAVLDRVRRLSQACA